jgi:hypothetical protein
MAQLLSILALSTKAMTGRRISELIGSLCNFFLVDCDSEKILKKLVGKADVEDAVSRLDMLTKEESLMILTRNLEVTHHVDDNVEATKILVEDINDNVKGIEGVTRNVDDNVETTKVLVEDINQNVKGIEGVTRNVDSGTQHLLFIIMHLLCSCRLFSVSQHSRTRA